MADCCTLCSATTSEYSLPLKRDKETRDWSVTPVCARCRKAILREAKATGKIVKIYGLEPSKREVERRNAEGRKLRTVIARFGESEKVREKLEKVKPALRLVA